MELLETSTDTSDVRTSIVSRIDESNFTIYTVEISVPDVYNSNSSADDYPGTDITYSKEDVTGHDIGHDIADVITSTSSTHDADGGILYTVHVSIPTIYSTDRMISVIPPVNVYKLLEDIITQKIK